MHYHFIEDKHGDVIDAVPFCGDFCHRAWCEAEGEAYDGWNGCHEPPDYDQSCASCGAPLPGLDTLNV